MHLALSLCPVCPVGLCVGSGRPLEPVLKAPYAAVKSSQACTVARNAVIVRIGTGGMPRPPLHGLPAERQESGHSFKVQVWRSLSVFS